MANEKRLTVPGSDRKPLAGAKKVTAINEDEIVNATVILRRRQEPAAPEPGGLRHETRENFGLIHGASASDLAAVETFAHENGLTVSERHPERRSIVVSGRADAMQRAFGTELAYYETANGVRFRGRTGALTLTDQVAPSVMAVLGLDNRPAAKPHFRPRAASKGTNGSFKPTEIAQLYNFPTGVNGAGQTIAIIELGGGYKPADLRKYFSEVGVTAPKISAVSVDGGQNKPGGDADGEVMLDIEVAGSIANGANIVVYFAPNTDQGFHDAIATAAHDSVHKPSIMSISWGASEDAWTDQARNAMNAALQDAAQMGVTVTVAAGDDGSTDGAQDNKLHVDFPASSPNVLSCGGTKLVASKGSISSEVVWNELAANEGATGGGVSKLFPMPQFQAKAGVPKQPENNFQGRGVPDVSGDADPTTGYMVRVDGKDMVIGGTSAVAPLWAALVALINQQTGQPLGFANPLFYQLPESAFRDITSGTDGHFIAGRNWDCCTGLGSPNGVALVTALLDKSSAQTAA